MAARFTGVPKGLPISMLTLHRIMRGPIAIARTATPACSTAGDAPGKPELAKSRMRSRVVTSLQPSLKVGGYDIFRWQLCRSYSVNRVDLCACPMQEPSRCRTKKLS